ncbi:MAG TPA: MoxR family ATPase [Polyangia bacterium]|jgi:MoxR-like ATPase|nr:MoxR family ATPase [Polyangia bacterium]
MTTPAADVQGFSRDVSRLRDEVGKVIVGHEAIVEGVVTALLAGGHALLEGVPGLGKTMLVRTLADAVHLTFSRIQFTPDLMPADILGTNVIVEETGSKRFQFQRGPIFAHVVLADEINRATPKTQSALLEAMQEKSVTVAKTTYQLEEPFLVLATQNPLEMEGTYPLPEAQLDRFFVKLKVQFPSRDALHTILDRTTGSHDVRAEKVLSSERLLELRALVRQVPVARPVQDFCVRLIEGTHPAATGNVPPLTRKYVRYGSSPRGAQACLMAAKIKALLDGRFAVSTDDIRYAAKPALRHRLILNFEGEAEGIDPDTIIDSILAELPA